MTKHPGAAPVKRPRGRPPKPGGKIPKAEVQRAYRARLAAAGKIVRLVDADAFKALQAGNAPPSPGDESDLAFVRAWNHELQEKLGNALSKLRLLEERAARLDTRNAQLEAELKLERQYHNITTKDKIVLQQQIATLTAPKRRRR